MRAEKQNSATRKKQIAGAAMDLIAHKGMKGLSVAAVARKVGLVPSALYRHYRGKEEILDAAISLIRDLIAENIRTVRLESRRPLNQLELLMRRHMQMIQEFQAIPRIILSDELSASSSPKGTIIYKIIRDMLNQVAEIIQEGQRMKQIKADLDPESTSIILLGLVQPPAILWYLSKGKFDIARHMKKAWPIFKGAVQADFRKKALKKV
jgi:AcrR family transcriptional regulator